MALKQEETYDIGKSMQILSQATENKTKQKQNGKFKEIPEVCDVLEIKLKIYQVKGGNNCVK